MLADADRGTNEPEDERQLDFIPPLGDCANVSDDLFWHLLFPSPVFASDDLKSLHIRRNTQHVCPIC